MGDDRRVRGAAAGLDGEAHHSLPPEAHRVGGREVVGDDDEDALRRALPGGGQVDLGALEALAPVEGHDPARAGLDAHQGAVLLHDGETGELRAILGDPARIDALIREELLEIKDRYGDERRTEITHAEGDIDIEDLIADQQMVISITKSGYIKSLPLATYRQQKRGGIGVRGMDMKEEDYIEHLFVTSTHDFLLFFTNRGKVYRQKVYELPEAQRTAKGRALVNLLPLYPLDGGMAFQSGLAIWRGERSDLASGPSSAAGDVGSGG